MRMVMMEDFHLHFLHNQFEYDQLYVIDDDEVFELIEDALPKSIIFTQIRANQQRE